jgi:hypothetical protein
MGVVIDEMESTVESDAGVGRPAEPAEASAAPRQMPLERLAADLQRVARRQMRLIAD